MKIIRSILWKVWNFYVRYYQFVAITICILFAFEMQFILMLRSAGEIIYIISLLFLLSVTNKMKVVPEIFCLIFLTITLLYLLYIWEPLLNGEIWHQACRRIICLNI